MNAIVPRSTMPTHPTPVLSDLCRRHHWLDEGYPDLRCQNLPSVAEEAELRQELAIATEPVPIDDLQRAIQMMVAAYPQKGPDDARGYVLAVAENLAEYPNDVVVRACKQAVRTVKFLPSVAELVEIAEELVRPRRNALRNLPLVARERARREKEEQERRQREAERAVWLAEEERVRKRFYAAFEGDDARAWRAWHGLGPSGRYEIYKACRGKDDAALDAHLREELTLSGYIGCEQPQPADDTADIPF